MIALRRPLASMAAMLLLALPAQAALNCSIFTAPPMLFGTYNPLLFAALDAQTSMEIRCSGSGLALLRIHLGASLNGSVAARTLLRTGGNGSLPYGLYSDTARSTAWGDGTGGTTQRFGIAFPGSDQTFQIYGRIPARQNVRTGAYHDTVTLQIDW